MVDVFMVDLSATEKANIALLKSAETAAQ